LHLPAHVSRIFVGAGIDARQDGIGKKDCNRAHAGRRAQSQY